MTSLRWCRAGWGRASNITIDLTPASAVFAELLHAVYTVEARPTGRTASFYREPPWRPLIETAGVAIAGGRDRGEAIEQVLATIWATIERAESDTASDVSSEPL